MSGVAKAYLGAQIFDGQTLHDDHALVVGGDGNLSVVPRQALPEGCPITHLAGGVIAPRFVDLQVNGGGGVMFNDDQSVAALRVIAQAHATTGTGAILPTLITDTPARTAAAIDAVEVAIAQKVAGIVGIHLEGPHLSLARKGAHDPSLIRRMNETDLRVLLNAADRLANVMVTLAPENVTPSQISQLSDAGITVSLGHTDADVDTCHAAFDAGARCVTHLFNAMSQLGSRAPGLVGAALARDDVYAGLIADAIHVHPTTMRIALAAKPQSERVFLVTDAMATAGSDIQNFSLNGRDVFRHDGRLTLDDGTLAGADLAMPRAIDVMVEQVGDDICKAFARATSTAAQLLREPGTAGRILGHKGTALYRKRDATTGQFAVQVIG
ncbi:N-acetylglucosamine-6-phosphate deacetylase [Loktanella sp. D2R18]|uniref:N-acetylglucosamine-6-phosphate deacetylase n=1 Tax=Rhodobacterales TaxID=204455 RepID=UPI000DEB7320|nr:MULTISPECIES: N-acetylglucosamine-6-phosphate deacetylase [Rhodobacterales]MDO6589987.1 N-acetylglucosamine-6-phosphate deacetylase [Yoonia sp. 1_MG-2023]RBW45874.1 N-acetylglucosamine-6-phosphate deacetylase [Loktanella sp. D2R18]